MSGRRGWPEWLEPLRPDELTRRRLQNQVMLAAETVLGAPTRTWQDVSASWSAFLTPLAAGLAVAFGTLAYRASAVPAPASVAATPETTAASFLDSEIVPLLGADAEAPPAVLIDGTEVNREAVFRAALVSR